MPGIREGLQSLVSGGIPPKFLVIDDGWQVGLVFASRFIPAASLRDAQRCILICVRVHLQQTDVDPEYREMFGDEYISVEEVWEAERLALSTGGMDELAASGAGSSTYAVTATVTASAEEEKAQRKKQLQAFYQEGATYSELPVGPL